MDIFIPGVNLTKLRATAMRHQVGGVGYYPTSGSPFVHVDTGSVRAWPRMTRAQLKKVFPDGRTLHLPTDGKPLSDDGRALCPGRMEQVPHGAVQWRRPSTQLRLDQSGAAIPSSRPSIRRTAPTCTDRSRSQRQLPHRCGPAPSTIADSTRHGPAQRRAAPRSRPANRRPLMLATREALPVHGGETAVAALAESAPRSHSRAS